MDERLQATPVIAIIGRTNVGKSTLFNRLIERRKAIMSPKPGTTRDISFGHCHWSGSVITVIDTAGLDLTSAKATEDVLKRQAQLAMDKADLILFLVDTHAGLMPQDRALARHLKRSKKPVLLIANKADNPRYRKALSGQEWSKLGFGEPLAISAANGSGVGDMLDLVYDELRVAGRDAQPPLTVDLRVAIIGRPNVGKSSLLNALAGEERVIVSEVPHTTKEPQDTLLTYSDRVRGTKNVLLIDTVGIRKKARVGQGLERLGVHMSIDELDETDVVFLLIDAREGVGMQEKKLASLVARKSPGVIVVVNKWDLASSSGLGNGDGYRKYVAAELPSFTWAPVLFISALTGNRVGKLLDAAFEVAEQRERRLTQEELDEFIDYLKKRHGAFFKPGGNRPRVYGIRQTSTRPPRFMVVVKKKETLHPNFL
ncbi:hypothetical protein AMJ57_04620, partial [Parcubacteria bacterium SG8_24]